MTKRAYLDIETTGLSKDGCDITIIGIGIETGNKVEVVQLMGKELTEQGLLKVLRGVNQLYTYNGSRFDLPFIKSKLAIDLKREFIHTDLMYNCWKCNLKGGLKVVERRLGITRKLTGVDGWMAVQLWWRYCKNNDTKALKMLLDYNSEDVVNLKTLRLKLAVS